MVARGAEHTPNKLPEACMKHFISKLPVAVLILIK
jgi:hypothetical protein